MIYYSEEKNISVEEIIEDEDYSDVQIDINLYVL